MDIITVHLNTGTQIRCKKEDYRVYLNSNVLIKKGNVETMIPINSISHIVTEKDVELDDRRGANCSPST